MRHRRADEKGGNRSSSYSWPGYYRCDDLVPPRCDADLTVTTGHVETLRGWRVQYWRYTPSSIVRHHHESKFPVIVLNGGPGLPHNYVLPARSLACDGREVVFYDQAGTGASSQPPENDDDDGSANYPELFHIEYYAELELPALIDKLGFEKFHLFGTSWGTQIILQYAVSSNLRHHRYQHQREAGLQSLILNAPIADNRKFVQYQWDPVDGSLGTLPLYLQERLRALNRTQDFGSDEFQALNNVIMGQFNARLGMLVDCWMDTEKAGISNLDLDQMTGPTDFFLTGSAAATLTNWSVLDRLHTLSSTLPVQLNYGAYDMVRPRLVAETAAQLQVVECNRLARAGHALLLDAPTEVYPKIRDFLRRVEEPLSFRADPDAVCPVLHDNNQQEQYFVKMNDASRHHSGVLVLVALVCLVGVSFGLGFWVGAKRNKRITRGYEMVGESVLVE